MKKGRIILLTALLLWVFSVPSYAQESVWDMAQSDQYGKKAGGMLGRGLVNALTCFVDLITHTVDGTQEGPPLVGTLTGLGSGIACTALRATSGVLDIVTFWVPGFNGIPVSRSYHNCLTAEEEKPYSEPAPSSAAQPAAMQQAAPVVVTAEAPPAPKHDAYDYVKK